MLNCYDKDISLPAVTTLVVVDDSLDSSTKLEAASSDDLSPPLELRSDDSEFVCCVEVSGSSDLKYMILKKQLLILMLNYDD